MHLMATKFKFVNIEFSGEGALNKNSSEIL